jgi:hypothetical protein
MATKNNFFLLILFLLDPYLVLMYLDPDPKGPKTYLVLHFTFSEECGRGGGGINY